MSELAGLNHLVDDDRFRTNAVRVHNRAELVPIVREEVMRLLC